MIKHCAWCGRAFEGTPKQKCCSKECLEQKRNSEKPLCPYFLHERYGKKYGAIYCEGGVIRLSTARRRNYIRHNCKKIDGGECAIFKQLND